jgi:osmotically-inducible protein OsmY
MSHDRHLQQAVLAALDWEPSVTAAHIGVAAEDGIVTLSGHVRTFVEKRAAEAAARRVKGVKAVAEEIEVRLPADTKRTDEDIAAAVLERLAWDASVPEDAVMVKVENGWVTLTGFVEWFYQKVAAEEDVRPLRGVVGVSNQLMVRPRVNVPHISDAITHALHRSWFFDPKTISVYADGGRVVLSGTVRNPQEWQTAAATAWAAPGVTDVQNDIAVLEPAGV